MGNTLGSKGYVRISISLFVFVSSMLLPCNYCIQATDAVNTVLWKSYYSNFYALSDDVVLGLKQVSIDFSLIALDSRTGRNLWKNPIQLDGQPQKSYLGDSLISLKGTSLLLTAYNYQTWNKEIYCIDIQSGDLKWHKPNINVLNQWIFKDLFYYVDGFTINKIDIETGDLEDSYSTDVLIANLNESRPYNEQYILTAFRWVSCLDIKSNKIVWDTKQNWIDQTDSCISCDLWKFKDNLQIHKSNVIYVDHEKKEEINKDRYSINCRNVKTGQLVWKYIDPNWKNINPLYNNIFYSYNDITLAGDILIQTYVCIDDDSHGKKYSVAIDANTGKEMWRKDYQAITYGEFSKWGTKIFQHSLVLMMTYLYLVTLSMKKNQN